MSDSEDHIIKLNRVVECYENPPDGFTPFHPESVPVEDFSPSDTKAGGRTAVVKPYPAGSITCVGQYQQFQVLHGMGGQIHRALFIGSEVGRVLESNDAHEVSVPVNCDETMAGPTDGIDGGAGGDIGLAIRDRGRWYVVKLAQGGAGDAAEQIRVMVHGGNNNPYSGTNIENYEVPEYRPMIFPRTDPTGTDYPLPDNINGLDELPPDYEWDVNAAIEDRKYLNLTSSNTPTTRMLPYGFGWVKLLYPSRVGGFSWDADHYEHHLEPSDIGGAAPVAESAFVDMESNDTKIIIGWSDNLLGFYTGVSDGQPTFDTNSIVDPSTLEDLVTLSGFNIDTVLPIVTAITFGSPVGGSNTITLELDRPLTKKDKEGTVSLSNNLVVVDANSPDYPERRTNFSMGISVYLKQAELMYLPVINRSVSVFLRYDTLYLASSIPHEVEFEDAGITKWFEISDIPEPLRIAPLLVTGGNSSTGSIYTNRDGDPPEDWQDFNYDYNDIEEHSYPVYDTQMPDDVTDGYGYASERAGVPGGLHVYAEASRKNRIAFIANRSQTSFYDRQELVIATLDMIADDKEEPEYRAVLGYIDRRSVPEPLLVTMIGGNVISPSGSPVTFYGLKVPDEAVTEVPSIDPPVTGSTPDGLACADSPYGYIWVTNFAIDVEGTEYHGYDLPVHAAVSVYCSRKILMNVAGGGEVTVYVISG